MIVSCMNCAEGTQSDGGMLCDACRQLVDGGQVVNYVRRMADRHRRPDEAATPHRRYQNEYVRRMAARTNRMQKAGFSDHRAAILCGDGPAGRPPSFGLLEAAVLAAWRGYLTAEAPPPDAAEAYIAGWCLAFGFVAAHGLPDVEQVQELLIRHPAAPRGDDGAD